MQDLKRQREVATPVRSMAFQAGPDDDTAPAPLKKTRLTTQIPRACEENVF